MIEVGVAYPGEASYRNISEFAKEVYLREFDVRIDPMPDLFAYASMETQLVGCLGLYRAQEDKELLFESYISNAYQKISGTLKPDRSALAELGTRVVHIPSAPSRSGDISVALTAVLILTAHPLGIRYVGFTTTRFVKRVTDTLKFDLINLGRPNLSSKDAAFQATWQKFFRLPQICAGFHISSLDGCETVLLGLRDRDIFVRNRSS
ncbi:thermostable hemolysin [Patescibacteria group bacterium]|nr:thermostable hemolysin [Patescibacteria group bacterium]